VEFITEEQYQIINSYDESNKDNYEESLTEEEGEGEEDFITTINPEGNFEGNEVVIDQEEGDNTAQFIEETNEQPVFKRIKLQCPESNDRQMPTASTPVQQSLSSDDQLDEFDYFGKKVAIQLRRMSWKNQNVARKAEIEVLQLLMEYEEHLNKN
jgi:hypothetical protein